jgi:hypothetical protein
MKLVKYIQSIGKALLDDMGTTFIVKNFILIKQYSVTYFKLLNYRNRGIGGRGELFSVN